MNLTHVRKERPEKTTNNNIKKKTCPHLSHFLFFWINRFSCFILVFWVFFVSLVSFLNVSFHWLVLFFFVLVFLLAWFVCLPVSFGLFLTIEQKLFKSLKACQCCLISSGIFLVILAVVPSPFLDILKPEGHFSLSIFGVLKNIFHYSKNTLPDFSSAVSGNSEWFAHLLLQ